MIGSQDYPSMYRYRTKSQSRTQLKTKSRHQNRESQTGRHAHTCCLSVADVTRQAAAHWARGISLVGFRLLLLCRCAGADGPLSVVWFCACVRVCACWINLCVHAHGVGISAPFDFLRSCSADDYRRPMICVRVFACMCACLLTAVGVA